MGKRRIRSNGLVLKAAEEILYIFFVIAGFYGAFLLKFNMHPSPKNITPFVDNTPYIIAISMVIFYLYDIVSTIKKSLFENILIIGLSLALIDIITIAVVFFNRGFAFPRSVFLIGFVMQFLLIFATKIVVLKALNSRRKIKKTIVFASKEEAENLAKKILSDKNSYDDIGYISNIVDSQTLEMINKPELFAQYTKKPCKLLNCRI